MKKELELKSVIVSFDPDEPTEEVIIAIGDGKTKFDDNYPFDPRVYFYFENKAQYDTAKGERILDVIGFRVLEELD